MKELVEFLTESKLDRNNIKKLLTLKGMSDEICTWYKKKFSHDIAGEDILAGYTFSDLLTDIVECKNIFDSLGNDSIVRERVFNEAAKRAKIHYNDIYDAWSDVYYK